MLGGQDRKGHPEDRVGTGGEHLEAQVGVGDLNPELATFRPSDPILLHDPDPLGPLGQRGQVVEEPLGVVGDLEEPLLQITLDDDRAASFAGAVDHLLVGQDGLVLGAPIDRRLLLVGESPFEQLQEQPLVPLVVLGGVRGDLPGPVVHGTEPAQLGLHRSRSDVR